MNSLKKIIEEIGAQDTLHEDIKITGVTDDSRKVKQGYLFIAYQGLTVDGHSFIDKAIEAGAVAVVGDKDIDNLSVPYIKVDNSKMQLGIIASAFYDHPSKKLTVIAVTGTDGKTTTTNIIYNLLQHSQKKTGLISTINAKIGREEIDTGLHVTNPDAPDLHRLLAKMVDEDCEYAVVEVTSHGIDLGRISGLDVNYAILTNITHEHMDYHSSFEEYRNLKGRLFEIASDAVVLNKDDKSSEYIKGIVRDGCNVMLYSIKEKADIFASDIRSSNGRTNYRVDIGDDSTGIDTNLVGDYNISNALASIGIAYMVGISFKDIQDSLKDVPQFEGRMEEIKNGQDFRTIVDFAHTPNSLGIVIDTLKKQLIGKGRLIVIFGCAGRRDIEKRKMMPEIAVKNADISIFTAEDPRDEDLGKILEVMATSARNAGGVEIEREHSRGTVDGSGEGNYFLRIPERGEAISFAIQKLAKKDDIVAVLGKGHEKSMCYGTTEYPWTDQEAVKMALNGGVKEIKR